MVSNFRVSAKTRAPQCCGFSCCGNKFGRIERASYCRVHSGLNRIIRTRRYAKHVERQMVRKEIQSQLIESWG